MARTRTGRFLPAVSVLVLAFLAASAYSGVASAGGSTGPPAHSSSSAGPESLSGAFVTAAAPRAPTNYVATSSVSGTESIRPGTATPSSDIVETPPPAIPRTQPTTFVVASNVICPSACSPLLNVTAPAGPWALVLLNFTGSVVGSVYDSSYHATVNGVPVLFGTTPELYTWTVLKDLTEYSALFDGTATFQFVLGQATLGGHFVLNVSLSFYPVPAGSAAPNVPTEIVPLWPFTSLSNSHPLASVNATIPNDVENATLELYSYGFSDSDYDEFWYSGSAGFPAYRAIGVTVNGTPLATVQPFEYVNTGGLDLYLWDPVTGAYTADDLAYEVDVTAALGLLEGTHTFNATVVGRESGSGWFVGGSLLLYTNASYSGATLVADPAPVIAYTNGTSGMSGIPPPESVSRSYSYESNLSTSAGVQQVESWTNETFRSTFPIGPNPNETGAIVHALTDFQESAAAPWGDYWRNTSSAPSIAFESGAVFLESSSTGGGYPIYGNVTQTMYWLDQDWNLTSMVTVAPTHGSRNVTTSDSNDNVTANGEYSGEEKEISQAAAELISITAFWSNTTKSYTSSETSGPLSASYSHSITSQLTPAELSTNLAVVLADNIQYTDSASLNESSPATDVGQANTLSVRTLGFGAPFDFVWTGLPSGCVPSPLVASVVCRAESPNTYVVSVSAVGVLGQATPPVTVSWTVYADPTVSVGIRPIALDIGRSTNLSLDPAGGLAPYRCSWTANGVPIGPGGACAKSFAFDPAATGVVNITVDLTDSLGVSATNYSLFTVEPSPTAILQFSNPSNTAIPTIKVGDSLDFTTSIVGGVAPFLFHWFIDDGSLGVATSAANFTYQPTSPGNVTISVEVTDSDGITVTSPGVNVDVTGSGPSGVPGGGGAGGTSGGSLAIDAFVGVGVVAVAVVLLLVVLLGRRKQAPPMQ